MYGFLHGFLQARMLECVDGPSSRGSSPPHGWNSESHSRAPAGSFFTISTTWEAPKQNTTSPYKGVPSFPYQKGNSNLIT